jgi:cell division GTPase FtsZ
VLGREVSLMNAFREANDVLLGAVQGIAELITRPGLINVDFADVRTVMSEMGLAMMGTGKAAVTIARSPPPRRRSATRCSRTSTSRAPAAPSPLASWYHIGHRRFAEDLKIGTVRRVDGGGHERGGRSSR